MRWRYKSIIYGWYRTFHAYSATPKYGHTKTVFCSSFLPVLSDAEISMSRRISTLHISISTAVNIGRRKYLVASYSPWELSGLNLLPPDPPSLWQLKYVAATMLRWYWRAKFLELKLCRMSGAKTVPLPNCWYSTNTIRWIPDLGSGLS